MITICFILNTKLYGKYEGASKSRSPDHKNSTRAGTAHPAGCGIPSTVIICPYVAIPSLLNPYSILTQSLLNHRLHIYLQ